LRFSFFLMYSSVRSALKMPGFSSSVRPCPAGVRQKSEGTEAVVPGQVVVGSARPLEELDRIGVVARLQG
jgi:hypothetical protein